MKLRLIASTIFCIMMMTAAMAEKSQKLTIVGGETSSLQEQMEPGKWTIVMIWSNDCHICNEEASKYISFHNNHSAKDAKIIGISLDGNEGVAQSFVSRHKLNYPNLVGSIEDVATLYSSETGAAFRATPTFMVYDPQGELRAAQAGGVPPKVIEDFMKRTQS